MMIVRSLIGKVDCQGAKLGKLAELWAKGLVFKTGICFYGEHEPKPKRYKPAYLSLWRGSDTGVPETR